MLKGFSRGAAPGAERGSVPIKPGRVGCEVAFARPHLMEATGHQLGEAHEGVGRERRWVRIAWGRRSERAPLPVEDRPGFFSEGGVRVRRSVHRGDANRRGGNCPLYTLPSLHEAQPIPRKSLETTRIQ